jgi:hypothetical protein
MGMDNLSPQTAFVWFVKIKLAKMARQISVMEAMEALKMRRPMENLTSQRWHVSNVHEHVGGENKG